MKGFAISSMITLVDYKPVAKLAIATGYVVQISNGFWQNFNDLHYPNI